MNGFHCKSALWRAWNINWKSSLLSPYRWLEQKGETLGPDLLYRKPSVGIPISWLCNSHQFVLALSYEGYVIIEVFLEPLSSLVPLVQVSLRPRHSPAHMIVISEWIFMHLTPLLIFSSGNVWRTILFFTQSAESSRN